MTKLNILYVRQSLSGLVILGCFLFGYTFSSILSYVDRFILTLGSLRYYCSLLIHVIGVCVCVNVLRRCVVATNDTPRKKLYNSKL
jgi:ABC-type siderophore export system fused ATPase/permease subunit